MVLGTLVAERVATVLFAELARGNAPQGDRRTAVPVPEARRVTSHEDAAQGGEVGVEESVLLDSVHTDRAEHHFRSLVEVEVLDEAHSPSVGRDLPSERAPEIRCCLVAEATIAIDVPDLISVLLDDDVEGQLPRLDTEPVCHPAVTQPTEVRHEHLDSAGLLAIAEFDSAGNGLVVRVVQHSDDSEVIDPHAVEVRADNVRRQSFSFQVEPGRLGVQCLEVGVLLGFARAPELITTSPATVADGLVSSLRLEILRQSVHGISRDGTDSICPFWLSTLYAGCIAFHIPKY